MNKVDRIIALCEAAPYRTAKYWLAYPITGLKKILAVSVKGVDEAVQLANDSVNFLTQIEHEGPLTWKQLDKRLDDFLDYTTVRGKGVDKIIDTI